MALACDGFNSIAGALNCSRTLSAVGVPKGVRLMGSLLPAGTYRMSFPKGQPDGGAVVRDLAFRDGCACFAYLSRTSHGI